MRIHGCAIVRNEADLIEAFVRHNLTVLDGIVVIDHMSQDGTFEILQAIVAEGLPVYLARETSPVFDKFTLCNRLVRHVFATSDADWVLPLDADEFVKTPSRGTLEALLAADESSPIVTIFDYLRSGRPLSPLQLKAFAVNYSVPMDRWLPVDSVELVDDPFLAPISVRHAHRGIDDPLALVLAYAESLIGAGRSA